MLWLASGYIVQKKGFEVNWVKATSLISKKKVYRRSATRVKSKSTKLLKLNDKEAYTQFDNNPTLEMKSNDLKQRILCLYDILPSKTQKVI